MWWRLGAGEVVFFCDGCCTAMLCGNCSHGKKKIQALQFWGAAFSVVKVGCGGGGCEKEGAPCICWPSVCLTSLLFPSVQQHIFAVQKKIGRDRGSLPLYRLNKHTCMQYVSWTHLQTTQDGWRACKGAARRTKKRTRSQKTSPSPDLFSYFIVISARVQ